VRTYWRKWAGLVAAWACFAAMAQAPVDAPDEAAAAPVSQRIPLDEIRRFVTLFNTVRDGYVDAVDDDALMSSAIRGLLRDLDPHSAYLEKDAAEELAEHTSGAYGGIGIEVLYLADGWIRIISPIDDTPATRAGLRAGDTITAVDGEPLTPGAASSRELLRGAPGTEVVLSILREGEDEPLQITVTREIIKVVSVRSRMLEPGYGYIRLSAFQLESAEEFRTAVAVLNEEAGGQLQGLVIDLRSNPGGVLTAAVEIADALLDSGVIVSTRGRMAVNDSEFTATPGDILNGAPVVLIVDAGSASASEVLAGALGDHGRARIIGSRTFGKGSVQTVMNLNNGDAVKLTIARYYTPGGRSIQARGIDPDLVLHPDGAEQTNTPPRITEAALPGHLRGEMEDRNEPGDVLDGSAPIDAALAELKRMVATPPSHKAAHQD